MKAVLQTDISEYPLFSRGKVRDVYDLGERLLIVTTDRVSAFDVIMPNGIPGRGRLLTEISVFWFDFLSDVVGNHLITADLSEFPAPLQKYPDVLEGRSMIVTKAKRIDIECVVRGYISGSLWKEYRAAREAGTSTVHNIKLPDNLENSSQLPEPIFTPATKAEEGHDENISFERMTNEVGEDVARKCKDVSMAIYKKASDYARTRGIIIADTKFEFGFDGDRFILIDEVLSPDSSRFWPADEYKPGRSQPSFDKQIIRNYLETLDWDKTPPGPHLPDEIVNSTRERYEQVVKMLTNKAGVTNG
jgi:phosphoribosylaminoimidazole-succinocarboxamide synthase